MRYKKDIAYSAFSKIDKVFRGNAYEILIAFAMHVYTYIFRYYNAKGQYKSFISRSWATNYLLVNIKTSLVREEIIFSL